MEIIVRSNCEMLNNNNNNNNNYYYYFIIIIIIIIIIINAIGLLKLPSMYKVLA